MLPRWTAEALGKYMKSVRSEAPYLPSNIQYIANNNGLENRDDVSVAHTDATAAMRRNAVAAASGDAV